MIKVKGQLLAGKMVLAEEIWLAIDFWSRLKGLLGQKELPPGHCLVISPCQQVHSIGMRFPIDVLFLGKGLKVVGIIREMPPGKIGPWFKEAKMAIEFPGGSLPEIEKGTVLVFNISQRGKEGLEDCSRSWFWVHQSRE